ncbi:MAG TPA: hypothetical protein PL009_08425 [Flavipsychrobacter sp.]|nr:hypothetical protein [Flavipsychrobacter sp.]
MEQKLQHILKTEGVVRNEPAMWIRSDDVTEHGRLILTTKRLLFARNILNTSGFSRYFINDQALQPVIEIDLDTINIIARQTYVVDNNVIALTYLQYETARFSVIHYEEWETDIQRTRMNPDIPGDPNRDEEAA